MALVAVCPNCHTQLDITERVVAESQKTLESFKDAIRHNNRISHKRYRNNKKKAKALQEAEEAVRQRDHARGAHQQNQALVDS